MKQAMLKNTSDLLHRIDGIEKEIKDLKLSVLKKLTPASKKVI